MNEYERSECYELLREIPVSSTDEYLKKRYSNAINKELQRQCDVWNAKV